MKIVRCVDWTDTPWRNGGGVMHEIVQCPGADGALLWSVGVADIVSPGPFSHFPGMDRFTALLTGGGLELEVDGQAMAVSAEMRLIFYPGDRPTRCVPVAPPLQVLNLMVARGHAKVFMRLVQIGAQTVFGGVGSSVVVFCTEGRLTCANEDLGVFDCAFADGPLMCLGEGRAWVIEIHPRV